MFVPQSLNKLVDYDVIIGLWPIILCPEFGIMVLDIRTKVDNKNTKLPEEEHLEVLGKVRN